LYDGRMIVHDGIQKGSEPSGVNTDFTSLWFVFHVISIFVMNYFKRYNIQHEDIDFYKNLKLKNKAKIDAGK
jgi:hypothetical protein